MKTKQATTKVEVLAGVLMQYRRWPIRFQLARKALTRFAYRKAGMTLNGNEPNLPTIAAACYEQKTRLGRDLTSTELVDIKGWAT